MLLPRWPALALAVAALTGCSGRQASPPIATPDPDPLPQGAVGVERVRAFAHPSCAAHAGVDAVRMPRPDPDTGDLRDDWLLVTAGSTGVYGALVDDAWTLRDEAFWPVPGQSLPWSDVRAARLRDPAGRERAYVYHVSQGSGDLQITDVTDFPLRTTVRWPIDLGLPVAVHGAHTLQIDAARGVLVLNGVRATGSPLPPPLTEGCAPAAFFDVATDPMHPRLLSLFVGPDDGDQVLFDSQFLEVDGQPLWAATIQQPQRGNASYFAFYDASDPTAMATAARVGVYLGPASGAMHNVVALPPRPDGAPRLCAGFEAFAFGAGAGDVVGKAGVLDARDLLAGAAPQLVGWLVDDSNRLHAVHNPAARVRESAAHTFDAVPLAHFTAGYCLFRCDQDQGSVELLARVPLSDVTPSADAGRFHPTMNVPTWPAVYNGAWDAVATPIGDFVSSTDREASYLIEPTFGFVRRFGSYVPGPDGAVLRVVLRGPVPTVGDALQLEVQGAAPGVPVHLLVGTAVASPPVVRGAAGAIHVDPAGIVLELEQAPAGTAVAFALPPVPGARQLVLTAWQPGAGRGGAARRSPAGLVRLRSPTARSTR
ncbi:MAG: hypothetical protein AB7O97_12990 [Planctomycetota bacterium]